MKKSRGFSGVEAFLVVLVIVIIGALGYVFLNNTLTNKTQSNAANSVPTAAIDIKSTSDIDKVSSDLNSLNVESDSSSDLDSITTQLNSF